MAVTAKDGQWILACDAPSCTVTIAIRYVGWDGTLPKGWTFNAQTGTYACPTHPAPTPQRV